MHGFFLSIFVHKGVHWHFSHHTFYQHKKIPPRRTNKLSVGIYKIVPKIPVSITAVLVFYTLWLYSHKNCGWKHGYCTSFLSAKNPTLKTHPFKTVQINTYLKDYTSPSRDYNYGYKIPPQKIWETKWTWLPIPSWWCGRSLPLCSLLLALLSNQRLVDVRDHTSSSDGSLDERVQFLISADGQL